MLFNSIEFFVFLPIVFAIYWLLRNQLKLQNLFVVLASYVFYGWWDWRFLLLIAFTSLCSWYSGILIGKQKTGNPESSEDDPISLEQQTASEISVLPRGAQTIISRQSSAQSCANALPDSLQKNTPKCKKINAAKAWMITNIVLNLGILATFKYYDFFMSEFGAMFGISTESLLLRIILPVGISFYTFQALSYSIDVYRGNIKPTKDIVAFLAFISFFPQLVAGPIERATNLLPQFLQKRTFSYGQGVDGMRQILWGLFKKIVVADNCAMYVDQVWATYDTQSGSTLLLAAILFTFQIYGDFSGYSDIAIGTAKLFGIKLMRNFNNPYFSRDIAEFWRRWHISLTTWFRDYVYIPLGGSRVGKWKIVRNTFVIFLLSGFWHGANWTFIAWGAYHAVLFLPLILLGMNRKYTNQVAEGRWLPNVKEIGQILLTFMLAVIGWIIFRAQTITDAWHYICGMMQEETLRASYLFFVQHGIRTTCWLCLVMLIIEWMQRNRQHGLDIAHVHPIWRVVIFVVLVEVILFFLPATPSSFIYFQF